MTIKWNIRNEDINSLQTFIQQNNNPFVEKRISKNINRIEIKLDKNTILKNIIMCLLTSQQRSGPYSPINELLRQKHFPITTDRLSKSHDIEKYIRKTLKEFDLNRFINKIPNYFFLIYQYLHSTNWELLKQLELFNLKTTPKEERQFADYIDEKFKGFGPKQSRNFLQELGVTKYEIPIDSRITKWLNKFGFPVTLSSKALADKGYYHFVSDGIQQLCKCADIYPCILDAAIFSSYDNGQWTDENIIN